MSYFIEEPGIGTPKAYYDVSELSSDHEEVVEDPEVLQWCKDRVKDQDYIALMHPWTSWIVDKLYKEEDWIQNDEAQTEDGKSVMSYNKDATKFCLTGAMDNAFQVGQVLRKKPKDADACLPWDTTNIWCYAYWTLKQLTNEKYLNRTVKEFDEESERLGIHGVHSMNNYIVWFNDHESTEYADVQDYINRLNDPENMLKFFHTASPRDIEEIYVGDDDCTLVGDIRNMEEYGYGV